MGKDKKKLKLSLPQRRIIIGCILGDANLRIPGRSKEANLIIEHSLKQQEYVRWKYQQLKEFVTTPPKSVERIYRKDDSRKTFGYRFLTVCHPEFTKLYRLFYKKGRKSISKKTVRLLNSPISLACWIMDDGNRNHNALFLNTQHFSLEEQRLLKYWLKKKFGFNSTINKHSTWKGRQLYRLRIDTESTRKLYQRVRGFILHSMRYKFPLYPVTT